MALSRETTPRWAQGAGVLTVDYALADEHDRLHGDTVRQRMAALPLEFEPDQVVDPGSLAHVLVDALRHLREPDDRVLTATDQAAIVVLGGLTIDSRLEDRITAYEATRGESASATGYTASTEMARSVLADAVVPRLNALLRDARLWQEPAFKPFIEGGALDELGDGVASSPRLANRLLLEAVFPTQLARMRDRRLALVYEATRRHETAALCLSGGGIRSATFALGVLRGLAKHRLLGKFDYLSTVSGGGFIGGWLSTWMHHAGAERVQDDLGTRGNGKLEPEPAPVRHLRSYSHYLTPRVGALSADTWTLAATLMRNMLLNWFVLLPVIAAVILVPRLFIALVHVDFKELPPALLPNDPVGDAARLALAEWVVTVPMIVGGLLAILAVRFVHRHRAGAIKAESVTNARFLSQCLAPLLGAAMLLPGAWYLWWHWSLTEPGRLWLWFQERWPATATENFQEATGIATTFGAIADHRGIATAFVIFAVVIHVVGWAVSRRPTLRSLSEFPAILIAGTLAGLIMLVLAMWFVTRPNEATEGKIFVALAPPAFLALLLIGTIMFNGWTSHAASDAEREWSARFNAWLLIVIVVWSGGSAIVLFGPDLVGATWQRLSLLGIGGASGIATFLLGRNPPPPRAAAGPETSGVGVVIKRAALALAAPAFAISIVVTLSFTNERLIKVGCEVASVSNLMQCRGAAVDSVPLYRITPARVLAAYETDYMWLLVDDFESSGSDSLLADRVKAIGDSLTKITRAGATPNMAPVIREIDSLTRHALKADSTLLGLSTSFREAALAADSATVGAAAYDSVLNAQFAHRLMLHEVVDETLEKRLDARDRYMRKSDSTIHALVNLHLPVNELRALNLERTEEALAVEQAMRADSLERAKSVEWVRAELTSQAPIRPTDAAVPKTVLLLLVVMVALALLMGWRIDTNTFSLHGMYHARLVRAYLGASRPVCDRNANPFTGFDPLDDIPMKDLWPAEMSPTPPTTAGAGRSESAPPLHVVNVALNVVSGRNLSWQQRKAASMTMTPLHAGSAFLGYRRTSPSEADDGPVYGGSNPPITLGKAITISGAAASPNAGYHSSPLLTFLMTFFNARLGAWLGNPGAAGRKTFHLPSPTQHLSPILTEMFGLTTDTNPYVYLSDGGHFENLALYEMVLRRNRFILVSDAGCDPDCSFDDLGNAIRKIRVDLGVPIVFPNEMQIRARGQSVPGQNSHWAVGRIMYSAIDMKAGENPDDFDGILLYIKPAVYGDEPRDVFNYAQSTPTFPHESTTDQFFSESQFESYRALGEYTVDQMVKESPTASDPRIPGRREGSMLSLWPDLARAMTRDDPPGSGAPGLAPFDYSAPRKSHV